MAANAAESMNREIALVLVPRMSNMLVPKARDSGFKSQSRKKNYYRHWFVTQYITYLNISEALSGRFPSLSSSFCTSYKKEIWKLGLKNTLEI